MNAYATPSQNFSRRFEEVIDHVSDEVKHAVRYVDVVIVPEVRRESSIALRQLAGHLERLAETLHRESGPQPPRS